MASENSTILRLGFGGTLFSYRPGIDDRKGLVKFLREWFWEYRPDYLIPTSRCGFYLFRGIARFKEKYPDMAGLLQVDIWGNIADENKKQVKELGIEDIVSIEGYMERAASRAKLDACDALFLPLELAKPGYKPLIIPGKVFEYLQAGKPVLTIGQDSDAMDIMQRSGLGVVHQPEDVEGIADSLRQLILDRQRLAELYRVDEAYIAQFDFRNLAGQLAGIFVELSSK